MQRYLTLFFGMLAIILFGISYFFVSLLIRLIEFLNFM